MRKSIHTIACCLCGLLLAACGSKKAATSGSTTDSALIPGTSVSLEKMVEQVNANRQTEPCLTAKMNLALKAGEKDVSVSGSLRMKRDDVIQLSLTALGMFEVGRMELTQDYMMIIDRMGSQYVKVPYTEIPFLQQAGIDFFTFQSLFWDELFLLGDKGKAPSTTQFKAEAKENAIQLRNADSSYATLTFLASVANSLITETQVSNRKVSANPVLDWRYSNHEKLGARSFPTQMQITVNATSTPIEASISLSRLKSDSDWETRTTVSKKYTQVSAATVLKRIMSLTK